MYATHVLVAFAHPVGAPTSSNVRKTHFLVLSVAKSAVSEFKLGRVLSVNDKVKPFLTCDGF